MNLVLGLSMTSSAVRWVLVDGPTGDGDTVGRGACALTDSVEAEDLLDVVLADEYDGGLHAIGVTWTNEAEAAASDVLDALAARGFANVIAVSELEAADLLAAGLADIGGYDDLAVCVVEPEAMVVVAVKPDGGTVDRIARPLDGTDVAPLPQLDDWTPDAVFVLGSAEDLDVVMAALADTTDAPVLSAADADLALARGTALASARAVNAMAPAGPKVPSKVGALASVLAAAVVTFVVSLSVAVVLSLTPSAASEQPQAAASATDPVDEPAASAPAPDPAPGKKVSTPAEARPVLAQTIAVAAPPPPAAPVAEPVYVPPAPEYVAPAPAPAYTPPEPAYVPPPAPAYVPPPQQPAYIPPPQQPAYVPAPKPRLRDRIIERIPIINRFHEPEYPYPR
ncbi:DUF7159 family protein [Mycolicibacterium pulveris]|uniref:DUF7159 family protein n=1 Tax=Mycolicibacterium pulveris TaxID=36813 RepID=UPI003CF2579D